MGLAKNLPTGEWQVTISPPLALLEDLRRAAKLRGQSVEHIITKALLDNDAWKVKRCKAGNCNASPESDQGGRMGHCREHYAGRYTATPPDSDGNLEEDLSSDQIAAIIARASEQQGGCNNV
tara:strand:- start:417 stop:782 length:366 start_codon:yes stop_codon:yes gene_type:complete